MTRVAIALGSNVNPHANVPEAVRRLRANSALRLVRISRVYATPAVGPAGQPGFHNMVVLAETPLGPLQLRDTLRGIEAAMGRVRSADRYAPRPIDLDIVFYDSLFIRTNRIEIPDEDALRQPHISVPLADVAPGWIPPGAATTAREAAAGHRLVIIETDDRGSTTDPFEG